MCFNLSMKSVVWTCNRNSRLVIQLKSKFEQGRKFKLHLYVHAETGNLSVQFAFGLMSKRYQLVLHNECIANLFGSSSKGNPRKKEFVVSVEKDEQHTLICRTLSS